MDKFQRIYSLRVQDQNNQDVLIELPFTIDFEITRNMMSSANTFKIRIYNLSAETRRRLLKNPNLPSYRICYLKAGYYYDNTPIMPTILFGQIRECYSYREHDTFVTEIDGFDAGYAFQHGILDDKNLPPFPAGTTYRTIIQTIIKTLEPYGVSVGVVSTKLFNNTIAKQTSFTGNTVKVLKELTNNNFFVFNGIGHAVGTGELDYVPSDFNLITSENGLLGTPRREQSFLRCEMLFEPRIVMAQKIELRSTTLPQEYNGIYQVVELSHHGKISPVECGAATTSLGILGAEKKTIEAIAIAGAAL